MTLFQSIVLGIVQGLTEFLPISSSGHLVIVPYLFGWHIPAGEAFIYNVLVQVATLVAVIAYFRDDLLRIACEFVVGLYQRKPFANPSARLGWYLILATIPAGLIGLLLKDTVEAAFNSVRMTSFFLFGTAALLMFTELAGARRRALDQLKWLDALWIGLFQALAIFPGISRSGATIAGGMSANLERISAARFSFLMSIPVMLAAGAMAAGDLLQFPNLMDRLPVFIPGFAAAALVGYLSIHWLLGYLTHRPLYVFATYCTILGFIVLVISFAA